MKTDYPHCPTDWPDPPPVMATASPPTPPLLHGRNPEAFANRLSMARALAATDPDLDHVDSWTGIDS